MDFNIVNQTTPPIAATIDGKSYTFRVFDLNAWGVLGKRLMTNYGLKQPPEYHDLVQYGFSPQGMIDVLDIAVVVEGATPKPIVAPTKLSGTLMRLVCEVLDLGNDEEPVPFQPTAPSGA